MLKNKGQGIVEGVFALGILGLVLTGVVVLLLLTMSNKKNNFDRKKATELGSMVMEELVSSAQSDVTAFWQLNSSVGNTQEDYEGYIYSVGFTNITTDGCGVGVTDCAEVVIEVGFSGRSPQSIYLNRFFSKE